MNTDHLAIGIDREPTARLRITWKAYEGSRVLGFPSNPECDPGRTVCVNGAFAKSPGPNLEDSLADWIERSGEGDAEAFSAVYDATSRRVFGLALKILRDRDAAEEAAAEAYAYMWRNAARYDRSKSEAIKWMLLVTRSRAIDLLRSRLRGRDRESPLEGADSLVDSAIGPDVLHSNAERGCNLRAAVAALPERQREVIEIAYFGGLSYSEVATSLGIPVGTVKTRVRAGLSTLRHQFPGPEGWG